MRQVNLFKRYVKRQAADIKRNFTAYILLTCIICMAIGLLGFAYECICYVTGVR